MTKPLLNGIESALRGAYEKGVESVYVQDARYASLHVDCRLEWRANPLQYALGRSIAGQRVVALAYDLNTDELASIAHVGVGASLVVIVVDNDRRPYCDLRTLATASHLPMMEPSTVYECKTFVKIACNLSEKYDVPVLVHVGQGLADTHEQVELADPAPVQPKPYKRNVEKYVTLPTGNKLCAEDMVVRDKRLATECEAFPVHKVDYRDRATGVVCYGEVYSAVLAAAPHLSVLRLGLVYPLPMQTIRDFAAEVEDLVVVEEGEPIVEQAMRTAGITCHGEDLFPLRMRYGPAEIKERLLGVEIPKDDVSLPIRTAAFCTDCPLIDLFIALNVGCGYLAANMPMVCVDTAFAASPVALGAGFATQKPCVCVLEADVVDLDDFRSPLPDLSVFIYGNVKPLEEVLKVLQPNVKTITAKEAAAYVKEAGVWLVDVPVECRHG